MAKPLVEIENLGAFRRDLRASSASAARELTKAIRRAGERVLVPAIRAKLPRITGELAKGVAVSARGTRGFIVHKAPHGPGSEWGSKGKWTGWVDKYGAPPRFVWPTMQERAEELAEAISEELRDVIEIQGWAR